MTEVNARPWFVAGFAHLLGAAALGALTAAPVGALDSWAHVLVALAGVHLIAGGLAHGFLSPFLKREPPTALLAHASLALVLVADALILAPDSLVPDRVAYAAFGLAFALLPLHVAVAAVAGPAWRGGVALFAKDQPFRRGDTLAAAMFGVALAMLLAASALLALAPRGLPTTGVLVMALGFAEPFFAAFLVFILPRNAKQPLPGLTLHAAALALGALGTIALAFAFAYPVSADFRYPAAAIAVAHALALVAFLRLDLSGKGPQLARARPLLRGAFVLAALAPIALVFALSEGGPYVPLLQMTLYAEVALLATTASACALFGAPILLNAVPRDGRWAAWVAGLAIAGAFVLASGIQFGRATFPGALVMLGAAAVLAWGVWPMRKPRRDCD